MDAEYVLLHLVPPHCDARTRSRLSRVSSSFSPLLEAHPIPPPPEWRLTRLSFSAWVNDHERRRVKRRRENSWHSGLPSVRGQDSDRPLLLF